jgi:hypothetical protein
MACWLFGCGEPSASNCEVADSPEPLELLQTEVKCSVYDYRIETDPGAANYGQLPCRALSLKGYFETCNCDELGFTSVNPEDAEVVAAHLAFGDAPDPACEAWPPCVCEFKQFTGEDLEQCHTPGILSNLTGWCLIEPELGLGNDEVSFGCKQRVRALGRAQLRGVLLCEGEVRDVDFRPEASVMQ